MTLPAYLINKWKNMGLLYRLATVQGLLLLFAAALLTLIFSYRQYIDLNKQLNEKATLLLNVAAPLILDQIVIGDFYSIKQMLDQQILVDSEISEIQLSRNGQVQISVKHLNIKPHQEWFHHLITFPLSYQVTPLMLGGVHYGELRVAMSSARTEDIFWLSTFNSLILSVGSMFVVLLALFFVLNRNLHVLRELAYTADRFRQGDYTARLRVEGAQEISSAAQAFNNVAEKMQIMLNDLSVNRQQLRAQLHFSEELIETLPLPFFAKDLNGNYTRINRAWEEFFGIERKYVLGRNVRSIHIEHPETAKHHENMDQALLHSGGIMTYGLPIHGKQGKEHYVIYTKALITDLDEKNTGTIGLFTDLTELKQAEREASEAVLEKTLAKKASETKSNFLSNMSHEIRTPMNSIIGMAYLALQTKLTPKQSDYITKIHQSAENLLGIINDILDFSKVEAGKLQLELISFRLDSLFDFIYSQFYTSAANKGLKLHFELSPALSRPLLGDPLRLRQVLTNFISNAIKFTEHGEINIRTEIITATDEGFSIRFEVQDTGIGLTSKQIDRLFTPFEQADSSTTRKYGGTGLGLAISSKLVELMNGEIGVDSETGKGSTFWFTIPLGLGIETGLLPDLDVDIDLSNIQGANILLVEDHIVNQQLAKELLENMLAHVVIASNGKQAIELLQQQSFDCVLMDVQMPIMDGYEATRQIRENPSLQQNTIIAMTANARHEDQMHCLQAGMNDFISKPINPQMLYATLSKWLTKKNHSSPPDQPTGDTSLVAEAPSNATSASIDLTILGNTWSNNQAMIRKYALMFVESIQQDMNKIETALAQEKLAELNALGHRIKSSARSIGAKSFADLSEKLEHLSQTDENIKQAEMIIEQMRGLLMDIVSEAKTL